MIQLSAAPLLPAPAGRFRMTALMLALLAGCASVPAGNPMLEEARTSLRAVQDDPDARRLAAIELAQASTAMKEADAAWAREDEPARVDQLAYLARQRAGIAQATTRRRLAETRTSDAGVTRSELRLEARTSEADRSQRSAELAGREAEGARRDADLAEQRTARATADADAARRATDAARMKTAAAQLEAGTVQARNEELASRLKALDAKQTDRGMVVTIGDVLFDTNRSELRDAGLRSLDKLVAFMKQYPQRTALIEGFTDSTGSSAVNGPLSGRRAEAVRSAMVAGGISAGRLQAVGLGETHPVGANETAAGRQSNRRVEVIFSDDGGLVAPR